MIVLYPGEDPCQKLDIGPKELDEFNASMLEQTLGSDEDSEDEGALDGLIASIEGKPLETSAATKKKEDDVYVPYVTLLDDDMQGGDKKKRGRRSGALSFDTEPVIHRYDQYEIDSDDEAFVRELKSLEAETESDADSGATINLGQAAFEDLIVVLERELERTVSNQMLTLSVAGQRDFCHQIIESTRVAKGLLTECVESAEPLQLDSTLKKQCLSIQTQPELPTQTPMSSAPSSTKSIASTILSSLFSYRTTPAVEEAPQPACGRLETIDEKGSPIKCLAGLGPLGDISTESLLRCYTALSEIAVPEDGSSESSAVGSAAGSAAGSATCSAISSSEKHCDHPVENGMMTGSKGSSNNGGAGLGYGFLSKRNMKGEGSMWPFHESNSSAEKAAGKRKIYNNLGYLVPFEKALPQMVEALAAYHPSLRHPMLKRSTQAGDDANDDEQCCRREYIDALLKAVYDYWLHQRMSRGTSFLRCYHDFIMENWARQQGVVPTVSADPGVEDLQLQLLRLQVLRGDLDRARLIVDRVRRREKLKRDTARIAGDELDELFPEDANYDPETVSPSKKSKVKAKSFAAAASAEYTGYSLEFMDYPEDVPYEPPKLMAYNPLNGEAVPVDQIENNQQKQAASTGKYERKHSEGKHARVAKRPRPSGEDGDRTTGLGWPRDEDRLLLLGVATCGVGRWSDIREVYNIDRASAQMNQRFTRLTLAKSRELESGDGAVGVAFDSDPQTNKRVRNRTPKQALALLGEYDEAKVWEAIAARYLWDSQYAEKRAGRPSSHWLPIPISDKLRKGGAAKCAPLLMHPPTPDTDEFAGSNGLEHKKTHSNLFKKKDTSKAHPPKKRGRPRLYPRKEDEEKDSSKPQKKKQKNSHSAEGKKVSSTGTGAKTGAGPSTPSKQPRGPDGKFSSPGPGAGSVKKSATKSASKNGKNISRLNGSSISSK
jgi:hypothetical protein